MKLSPARYVQVCRVALALLCTIVVSGAAVRLTGSGLGCSDWPRCNDERFIDVSSVHGAIEQVNRLFTGLVSVAVIVAVLGALRRTPQRRDLVWLSWGLVAGVLGQIVLGGIVVLTDLNPVANQGHFLVSMFLVADAVILLTAAKRDDDWQAPSVSVGDRRTAWLLSTFASVAIITGTVVTGSGPHAGDEEAKRLPFSIESAARVHGVTVMLTLGLICLVLWRHRRLLRAGHPLVSALETVLAIGVIQAAVGYTQYFADIPAALVGVHIALATAFFGAIVQLHLVCTGRVQSRVRR